MKTGRGWQVLGAIVVVAACGQWSPAQDAAAGKAGDASKGVQTGTADGPAKFKEQGKAAAVTVLPMGMAGKGAFARAGEVLAMFLERGGMTNLETSTKAFTPPEGADLGAAAKAFAEWVKANPTPTEYALYVDFMGTRENGVTEVRTMVASTRGELVWQDRQVKGDADFDRVKPREPMQVCLLAAQRLRPVLGLSDPEAENAPSGKIAERFRADSGVPGQAEIKAIEQRGETFRKAAAGATLVVYPARAGSEFSAESAKALAASINDQKLSRATAADTGPKVDVAPDANEQKMLWAMARAFGEQVKKNPPQSDYAVFADYLMAKDAVIGVHLAVCNRQGELVVVDFQNDHHADFQASNPKTRQDCDRLLVKRLAGYCK